MALLEAATFADAQARHGLAGLLQLAEELTAAAAAATLPRAHGDAGFMGVMGRGGEHGSRVEGHDSQGSGTFAFSFDPDP
jgi:hypothetical protein